MITAGCREESERDGISMEKLAIQEKEVTLYPSGKENAPLIILDAFTEEGAEVYEKMPEVCCPDCNLAVIGNLKWNHDMPPWNAPALSPDDAPFTGGADDYIALLTGEILPEVKKRIKGTPAFTGITGYSLAGLFAVYAMYKTDAFDRAASISGSLWFPDFKEYCTSNPMKKTPEKIYLSLGDREAKTRNPLLRTVQENTESLAEYFKCLGIDVVYELNPGNHFKNAALRTAKGIRAILKD